MVNFVQDGHECDSPVTFAVGGTGIPVIDDGATVYERKDGHLSVNRRADVHFPLLTNDIEWVNQIDAFADGGEIQIADIAMSGIQSDSERHLIRGYVNGVGSRGAGNTGRVRILGPFKLLSSIRADITVLSRSLIVEDVLEWFVDRFESGQSIFNTVSLNTSFEAGEEVGVPEDSSSIGKNTYFKLSGNRDTLADAATNIINELGVYLEFRPDPNLQSGLILDAFPISDLPSKNFDATDDNELSIISNDALYEMRPFNSITMRGTGGTYIDISESAEYEGIGEIADALFGDGSYPQTTATYPPLVERAGGEIGEVYNSKASTASEVESEAISKLKNSLDEVSGGSILSALEPGLGLYDTVTAKPVCAGQVSGDVPELTYEVQRAEHTVSPSNKDNNIPTTRASVSMEIDPSLIEVETTRKTTQPSEGSENRPPQQKPDSGLQWGWR